MPGKCGGGVDSLDIGHSQKSRREERKPVLGLLVEGGRGHQHMGVLEPVSVQVRGDSTVKSHCERILQLGEEHIIFKGCSHSVLRHLSLESGGAQTCESV